MLLFSYNRLGEYSMEKKKNLTLVVIGLLAVVAFSFGASYAYFVSRITKEGEGSNVGGSTATKEDTVVSTTGSIGFTDTNIYPGHKNISKIVVTATGEDHVIYNLVWNGTNTLNTTINYKVYKTTTEVTPTITCIKREEGTTRKELFEECTENLTELGEVVSSGEIESSGSSTKVKLIRNEEIDATSVGAKVYYYVVLEYPNKEDSQNIDMNGSFTGNINVELLDKKEYAADIILANKTVEDRTSFSTTLTENTTGKIYKAEDDDGYTYYFAGAVDNNWVQFGTENGSPLYWRIIRINGDGTIRMIYNGTTISQTGTSTQIGTSAFNTNYNDNAYVGYMYGTVGSSTYEATHTNTNSSTIKQIIDEWYNTNLNKTGIKEKISINTGFCGDRSIDSTYGTGLGYGTNQTVYNGRNRLSTNKTPSLRCTNANDLYTVANANKGNKALTYPVGLITADEVAYAGGVNASSNGSYYLRTNQYYWTMTPYDFYGSFTYEFSVADNGYLDHYYVYGVRGVRPVINLSADVLITTGDGTTAHPYIVAN